MKQPLSRPHPTKNLEVLAEDYEFNEFGLHFIIKKGFPWDGATIPAIADRIVGHKFEPDNRLFSLVHDALFRSGLVGWAKSNTIGIKVLKTRKNVGPIRARIVLAGLRAGSYFAWRSHRKRPKDWQMEFIEVINVKS